MWYQLPVHTYYFDITSDGTCNPDLIGTLLMSGSAAWLEAIKIASELVFDEFPGVVSNRRLRVVARDESGKLVADIDLDYDPSIRQ